MKNSRKLAVGAVVALAAMPLLAYARTYPSTDDPLPTDFTSNSPESSYSLSPSENAERISIEKAGTVPTTDGMMLRVNADPGNIHIFTDESSRVSYCVRVEADAEEPGAKEFVQQFAVAARAIPSGIALDGSLPWRKFHGEFGVSYEIHIPRRYNLEVHTHGGNIELQDIEGRIDLFTDGGNITAGRVDAETVPSRPLRGEREVVAAKLETLGGHIRIGDVTGTLRATTSGGHITTGNIGGDGILRTGGGQIFTGRISGVATLDTGGGDITARFNQESGQADAHIGVDAKADTKGVHKRRGTSQLFSSEGDIVVYLPREMAATIDAVIDRNGGHRIVADASLPLKIDDQDSTSDLRTIRFESNLNGGGEVLHLRAVSGNIILKSSDRRMQKNAQPLPQLMQSGAGSPRVAPSSSPSDLDEPDEFNEAAGFFAEVRRRILESWWGGVPVDVSEMQKHLEYSVPPVYPDVARRAGIEGDVVLRILVSSDGNVTDLKVLDGPPILARAAIDAVRQWRYHALKVNGQPTSIVTTLIVSFRLH